MADKEKIQFDEVAHAARKGKAIIETSALPLKQAHLAEKSILLPPPPPTVSPSTPTKPSSSQPESSARATPHSSPNHTILLVYVEANSRAP